MSIRNQTLNPKKEKVSNLIAAFVGFLIACFIAIVFSAASKVWFFLVVAGVTVFAGSLIVKDVKKFYLGIFAVVVGINIKKVFSGGTDLVEVVSVYGFPPGTFPAPILFLSDLPLLMLLAIWFIRLAMKKETLVLQKTFWIAGIFVLWCMASYFKAPVKTYALWEVVARIKYFIIMLYFAHNLNSMKDFYFFIRILVLVSAFQGIISIYNYTTQNLNDPFGNLFGRVDLNLRENSPHFTVGGEQSGKFRVGSLVAHSDPNRQGQYYIAILPLCIFLIAMARSLNARLFWFICFSLSLTGLIVTFSRGALVGFLTSGLFWLILATYRKLIPFQLIFGTAALSLGSVPLLIMYFTTRIEYFHFRFPMWELGWSIIKKHPLTGVGINNAAIIAGRTNDPDNVYFGTHFHNMYITTTVELGIIGVLLFIWIFTSAVYHGVTAYHPNRDYKMFNWLTIIIPASMVALGTHFAADHLSGEINTTLLWVMAGAALSLYRLKQINQRDTLVYEPPMDNRKTKRILRRGKALSSPTSS